MFQSSNPFEDFQREMSEGYGTGKGGKVSRFTKHIVQYSENRTLSSVLTEVDKAASTTQAELDTNREISNIQQAINIKVQKHQDISAGLEQTSTYFSSMGQSLAEVNSGACEALRGKKSCE